MSADNDRVLYDVTEVEALRGTIKKLRAALSSIVRFITEQDASDSERALRECGDLASKALVGEEA